VKVLTIYIQKWSFGTSHEGFVQLMVSGLSLGKCDYIIIEVLWVPVLE
jgi:hypothetical protein